MTETPGVGHDDDVPNPPHHRSEIARRLRATRLALGLKPSELCKATGIGASTLSQYEAGLRLPDVLQLLPVCDRFNLTLDWVYRGHIGGLSFGLAGRIRQILDEEQAEADTSTPAKK